MNRTHNATCGFCGKPLYKRPSQKVAYCNWECFKQGKTKRKICLTCHNSFHPKRREQKYCSGDCFDNRSYTPNTKHPVILRGCKTVNQRRLKLLKVTFKIESCMVVGCTYHTTYDVHRLVAGCDGGKYEIGNMFAICPNHHAELHRKIARAEKVNDHQLKLTYE